MAIPDLVAPEERRVVVEVRDLRKSYGKTVAVDGIDLEIHQGEIYGLIGPDGAGKSSLMKAVAGVLSFDFGAVTVFGTRVHSERSAERIKDRLGFMPQGLGQNLYRDLTVEENVDFFARLRLVPSPELGRRKEQLLGMTRLTRFRDRPMKQLSGGMKQKLGLVCTLIHQPDLIVLDEPTTGVDPVSRRDFWAILGQLLEERSMTALVSTAYMDEASRCHRVSLLNEACTLAEGEPDEIEGQFASFAVTVVGAEQIEGRKRLEQEFSQVETFGDTLRIIVDEPTESAAESRVRNVLIGLEIQDVRVSRPELEDVFIRLLRERGGSDQDRPPTFTSVTPGEQLSALSPTPGERAIEANGLVRDFGDFRAVDQVSFSVDQGEIFGLLGANGAGKTTAIKMLCGILEPTSGEGRVAGVDLGRSGHLVKEHIGYMSQAFSLYLDLTVVENVHLYAGIYGLDRKQTRERSSWVMELAGLGGFEGARAEALPMGLRQRLALGCALIHRPRILFLDEPTSGVDPVGRRRFWDILFGLAREQGVAVLVTTHYMGEAEHCDRLALMYAGRVAAEGSPKEMKATVEESAGGLLEVLCEQPRRARDELLAAGYERVSLFGKKVHLLVPDAGNARGRVARRLRQAGVAVESVRQREMTMEDVFVYHVLALEHEEVLAGR